MRGILLLLIFVWLSAAAERNASTTFIIAGSTAGLANRLRVLAGYRWVAEAKYGCVLIFVWDVNNECPGHFLELYNPIPSVIFITSSELALFQSMGEKKMLKDYGMSNMDFHYIAHEQNDLPYKDVFKGRHIRSKGIEQAMYESLHVKKHIWDNIMIFVSTYDVCKGKAAHLRMTDSSANLNTYSYWEYVNSTSPGTRTFLMCDNPLSQRYFLTEFPTKALVYRVMDQQLQTNAIFGEVNLTEARAPSKYNVHFLEHKDKLPPVDSRQKNLSHVAMSEEDRESLPKQYRYTTLETTLADALIAAHAEDFKGAMFSSLTDLVNTLRPKARARCDKWAAG